MCTSENLALPGVRNTINGQELKPCGGGGDTETACTLPLTAAIGDTYLGRVEAHLFHHFRYILGMCHQTLPAASKRIYRHEHLIWREIFRLFSPVDPA